MKLRRKTALLMVIISVFAVVCAGGCGNVEEEKNTIRMTDAEVKAGEEITVYIRATDEIPVTAYGFEISYDSDALTFKKCEKTKEFEKAWNGLDLSNDTKTDKGQTVMIAGVNTNEDEGRYKGDLYYITFTASGKKGTNAELSLKVSALEDMDQNDHVDEFTVKNGTIKIK